MTRRGCTNAAIVDEEGIGTIQSDDLAAVPSLSFSALLLLDVALSALAVLALRN